MTTENDKTTNEVGRVIPGVAAGADGSASVPPSVWGYWNGGRLRFTLDKQEAEASAEGFVWDNPRVREMGFVIPCGNADHPLIVFAGAFTEWVKCHPKEVAPWGVLMGELVESVRPFLQNK